MASDVLLLLIGLVWLRLVSVLALGVADVARRRGESPLDAGPLVDVTFLVPAFDEAASVGETLRSTLPFLARGAALVVVDDGSRDATVEIARAFVAEHGKGQVLVHEANLGKAAALNTGLAAVATPLVVTLDADTRLEPGSVDAARAELVRRDAAGVPVCAVAFDVALAPSPHLFVELQGLEYDASLNFERRAQGVVDAISVCPGAASLWRVESLRAIGGFSDATATEDVDATLRLAVRGLPTAHHPGARAVTGAPRTWAQLVAQRRRWCLGHYQNLWRNRPRRGASLRYTLLTYPNLVALSAFLPALLLASLAVVLTEPETLLRSSLWGVNAAWLATAYAQRALALASVRRRTSVRAFLLEPMATSVVHLAALVSVLRFAFGRGERERLWQTRAR